MIRKYKVLVILFLLVILGIFLYSFMAKPATLGVNKTEGSEDKIKSLIPKNTFLREYQPLSEFGDNTFLVLYVENPKLDPETKDLGMGYFVTCLGERVGRGVEGIYHLALLDNGKIVSEKILPSSDLPSPDAITNSPTPHPNTIKIAYQNIKWNTHWDTG